MPKGLIPAGEIPFVKDNSDNSSWCRTSGLTTGPKNVGDDSQSQKVEEDCHYRRHFPEGGYKTWWAGPPLPWGQNKADLQTEFFNEVTGKWEKILNRFTAQREETSGDPDSFSPSEVWNIEDYQVMETL
jgi:hypothetical protein